jgi:(2R)-3-sulfolactate dehydrogenase (NADP+)
MMLLMSSDMVQLDPSEARALIEASLNPSPGAALAARAIVEAEQLGEPRFGLSLLTGIDEYRELPAAETLGPSRGRLDASGGFGPLAVAAAVEHAARLADETGLAFVTVAGLGRLGRLATYVEWAAERSLIAVIAVDAPPSVAPHGGDREVLGTNPLAYAIPGSPPIVADFATSEMTEAAARAARREGSIPPRGGLIGTLVGFLAEALTGAVEGRHPDRSGRTAAILLVRPRDDEATVSFAADLVDSLRQASAQPPGQGRRSRLDESRPVEVRAGLHRALFRTREP